MDQKNFIVAIVLSVLIIVGWQVGVSAGQGAASTLPQQQTATTAVRRSRPPRPATGHARRARTLQPGPGRRPGAAAAW